MRRQRIIFAVLIASIIALTVSVFVFRAALVRFAFQPARTDSEVGMQLAGEHFTPTGITEIPEKNEKPDTEIVAENLEVPWEVVLLPPSPAGEPSGEFLITERPGKLTKIDAGRTVIPIPGVRHVGEGGLLGLALHPNFSQNQYLYLYLTSQENWKTVNRVERYMFTGSALPDRTVIIDGIAGASNHDGGRIAFGPDGFLYITTGDAGQADSAQNLDSLNGKILRVRDDGSIPEDNPFNTAVYSYGHRNVQGIAWDNQGRLWATEHGRSGARSGYDELNLIEKGKNYGWPTIQGPEEREGMVSPVIQSGPNDTWAPSGAAFWNGSIFFAGLRGEALYEYRIADKKLVMHFHEEFGRLRAVVTGNDGFLYITTSNRDGRGEPESGDDKIIRVNPAMFR